MKKLLLLLASLSFLSALSLSVHADGENQTPRFVATTGSDLGDCSNRNAPCSSIAYVMTKAAKADPVYIAGGTYDIQPEDVVHFTGDKVPLLPGYNTRDLFNTKSIKLNPVILQGVPSGFATAIEAKGFKVISDRKGLSKDRLNRMDTFAKAFNKTAKVNNPASACTAGLAGNFPCHNIDMQSQISLNNFSSSPTSGSDIWGHTDLNNNREYALMGLRNGTAVVDVTDPINPVEVGVISGPSSTWRDIKVYQYLDNGSYKAYAYVTNESNGGLQVIDLNNLPTSVSLGTSVTTDFVSAHNIYISNVDYSNNTALTGATPFIYIAGAGTGTARLGNGAFRIFNLDNPAAPRLITAPPSGTGYVHDASSMIITDDRTAQCANNHNPCEVFIDFNETTVDLWDMTDKSAPFRISQTPYNGASYTHSGWYSKDQNFVFIQDELDEQDRGINTTLYVLDISNLLAPSIVGSYVGPTRAIDHNGFTIDDLYYMSNYRRGLTILDVSNPSTPTEFGFFDTFPTPAANSANFDGAWGVYPYLSSGNLLVSDADNGLFVLKASSNPIPFAGNIGISSSNMTVEENVGNVTINVSRTNGSVGEINVNYSTVDNTATAGSDYESSSGTLTWADGDVADKTITVSIIDDSVDEGNENFNIQLSDISNGTLANSSITIGINASDTTAVTPPTTPANPTPPSSGGGGGSLSIYLLSFLIGLSLLRQRKRYS